MIIDRGIGRQYNTIATAISPATTYTFVEMIKKWLMYIVVIYFNWFLVLWWINWEKKVYSAKKWPTRLSGRLVCHPRYSISSFFNCPVEIRLTKIKGIYTACKASSTILFPRVLKINLTVFSRSYEIGPLALDVLYSSFNIYIF